ncbi:AraC family ligand binding domain-containing protein [Xanthomonas fragariae]|uniref:AraC family ligand binding domain-containing protein n=1 Tax=Xanthomonas fragariae TaxID=48664 RepID=UPI00032704D9|nr:AraC family ligand binding domain-containing protein [Xanthomonas fragariae]AOD15349.1 hypothetical protein BER92_12165 [Xanthomonas fragariae]AOD18754.1 hypothetical protein BER93_12190 [Xanthomonas fragariae]ENZ93502.1 transcriptional regulator [Xanthomonas fragariae LMG 25863]
MVLRRISTNNGSVGAADREVARYRNGRARAQVTAQSLTLINPGEVHACNPDPQQDWSFRMLYLGAHAASPCRPTAAALRN